MKSIKPGRGPSRRGAAGSVIAIVWGILWTVLAAGATQGAGAFGLIFPLFGLCFIGMGVYNLIYHSKNASADAQDRDSLLEIVDSDEENGRSAPGEDIAAEPAPGESAAYCPWCGARIKTGILYCPKCGRKL